MSKKQKLELTGIGKHNLPQLEQRPRAGTGARDQRARPDQNIEVPAQRKALRTLYSTGQGGSTTRRYELRQPRGTNTKKQIKAFVYHPVARGVIPLNWK